MSAKTGDSKNKLGLYLSIIVYKVWVYKSKAAMSVPGIVIIFSIFNEFVREGKGQ